MILFCELKASAEKSFKDEWTFIICSHNKGTCSASMALYPVKRKFATCNKASLGHSKNQSIVVLLISPGKFLQRFRKLSPEGDIEITKCKFSLILFT